MTIFARMRRFKGGGNLLAGRRAARSPFEAMVVPPRLELTTGPSVGRRFSSRSSSRSTELREISVCMLQNLFCLSLFIRYL